jgi:hypothetical protein
VATGTGNAFDGVDRDELRERLRKMSDNQLIELGVLLGSCARPKRVLVHRPEQPSLNN